MVKGVLRSLLILSLILLPVAAMAELGQVVTAKDIEITMIGSMRTIPHFIVNPDFNSAKTKYDYVLDEAGAMNSHSIRNEARVGWKATGKDWDFLFILEGDFLFNKVNVDRQNGYNNAIGNGLNGAATFNTNNVEANSDAFGIEKINFGYDFGVCKLNTGWNTQWLDMMTGGLLYVDDMPYIGIGGRFGAKNKWAVNYYTFQDDISGNGGRFDGDTLDYRLYTADATFDVNGYNLIPMYAYTDNSMRRARVNYLGVQGYGPVGGIFTPRFELVYAFGDEDTDVSGKKKNYDISAWAAYASLEIGISKAVIPYFGGWYMSGDDDKNDGDINAFNGPSPNQRATPTFGMESGFVYRVIPALGKGLNEGCFQNLGSVAGYGGSSNGMKADAPGVYMFGAGVKGAINEQLGYKTQLMYFRYDKTDNFLIGSTTKEIDKEVGLEFGFEASYKFNPHFIVYNTVSVFFPGDGVSDRLGQDYDSTAFMDTVELKWSF
jgi:hypothetical protein